ncbi:MAG: HlyD family efflux transporter periplasmic adaptor subunit [Gallionella sp.]|nr:HlyD family efflux transporter periplasmic adaptor subunit [Gallionella sp.]
MSGSTPDNTSTANGNQARRKKWMLGLAGIFVLAAILYAAYWFFIGRNYEYSDDAYVAANIVQITPQVAGTAVAISVNDTDFVKAGEVLIRLDSTNAEIALQEAEAQLAQTVREVRTLYRTNNSLTSMQDQHRAELEQARTALLNAQADFKRRESLLASGAVSEEDVQHAQTALQAALDHVAASKAALDTSREKLRGNESLTAGIDIANHPRVLAAAARVKLAYLNLKRCSIISPVDGYVGKRSVQLGQRVAIGLPLLTIVPLRKIWVDANYKEAQLRHIRIGQNVELTSDVYGSKVEYHGRISGIGSGTGAAFALLPAQNATGNWIKVVQRVPVRIALDEQEVVAHPLRVGMSMEATVDLSSPGQSALADEATPRQGNRTGVYSGDEQEIDAMIARIISSNLGKQPAQAANH